MNPVKLCVFLLVCGSIFAQDEEELTTVEPTAAQSDTSDREKHLTWLTSVIEKVYDLETRMTNSETRLNDYVNKANTIVAFSAALGGDVGSMGPFNTDVTLIYKTAITDVGNAYNTATGIFTAPVAGVYYFTIFCHAGGDQDLRLDIYKNNMRVVTVSDHKSNEDPADMGGNAVFLQLQPGDQVYVRMRANSRVWANDYITTFSGSLVFQM